MDRFVAHCVATALITAALAAVSTVRAEPSDAAQAPAAAGAPGTAAVTTATTTTATAVLPVDGQPPAARAAVPPASVSMPIASPLSVADTTADPADSAASGISTGAVCADAVQVGPTVYARWHGEIAFSVKQFYSPSCHARYSYAFPWLQFRDLGVSYDIGLSVFDTTHDQLDGAVTYFDGVGSPNYWSAPVAVPRGTCTEATVHLFLPDDETDTYTQKYCR